MKKMMCSAFLRPLGSKRQEVERPFDFAKNWMLAAILVICGATMVSFPDTYFTFPVKRLSK